MNAKGLLIGPIEAISGNIVEIASLPRRGRSQ